MHFKACLDVTEPPSKLVAISVLDFFSVDLVNIEIWAQLRVFRKLGKQVSKLGFFL